MSLITKVRTIRLKSRPNLFWVEIETDEGLCGVGEAFRSTAATEGVILGEVGPYLLGKDSRDISRINRTLLTPYVGFHCSGAETRAASAVDIALWDLFGQRLGVPVYEALGGAAKDEVPCYNTCSGYAFNTGSSAYDTGNSRRVIQLGEGMRGPYDDQIAFTQDAGKLAESLVEEGYKCMKIWPLDPYAKATNGAMITNEDLKRGLEPFAKVREAVGDKIEIMAELHGLWSVPAALRILKGLEPYNILWAEDPICKMDDADSLNYLRSQTSVPICGSETLGGAFSFRRLFEAGAVDYAMTDLGWSGGLTEGRKIAALAEVYNIPLSPHDCTGPVALWAGVQLAFHAPSCLYMEVVRANMASWYPEMADALPEIKDGMFQKPTRPGIGCALLPCVKESDDAIVHEVC